MDQRLEAPFFPGLHGQPLNCNDLLHVMHRLGQSVGDAGVHPHRFRHTCAILLLRAGMNSFTLMHELGRRDLSMVRCYMAIVDSDVSSDEGDKSPLDLMKIRF